MATKLFTPLKIRGLEFKNRIVVSPMCQYSAINGVPNHWHLVHLGSRAVGGAALVIAEATGVSFEGRISPGDTGIWSEAQVEAFKDITKFIKSQNSIPGIQLAHAGRKASDSIPWENKKKPLSENDGAWTTFAPSAINFSADYHPPKEMTLKDIEKVVEDFKNATSNSLDAGFEVIEVHMAHGYLLHEFLSPLSNQRKDDYGGSLENRMRLPLKIASEVRKLWPEKLPVFVRISASDWIDGGWTLEDSVVLARELKNIGIDLIDCSSGGNSPVAKIKPSPGYQVHFADGVKKGAGILTGAVGLITEAKQAEHILQAKQADLIFLARELLRDPYWPLHAAKELAVDVKWPLQYERAKR